jgi:hypothetical protein
MMTTIVIYASAAAAPRVAAAAPRRTTRASAPRIVGSQAVKQEAGSVNVDGTLMCPSLKASASSTCRLVGLASDSLRSDLPTVVIVTH